MKPYDESYRDIATAYERLTKIHSIIKQVMASQLLNRGHEALIRFVYDLRDYMGWPDEPAKWYLDKENASPPQRWLNSFDQNIANGQLTSLGYTTRLAVHIPDASPSGLPGDTRHLVFIETSIAAKRDNQWMLTVKNTEVGVLDAASYETPEEILRKGADVVGRALYDRMWG